MLAPTVVKLANGAEARLHGQSRSLAVVCVNGGQAAEVAGTWSASIEWLVHRLVPRFPDVRFVEVRYRTKSWKRLDACVEDTRAAVDAHRAEQTVLLGFSMGGAVCVRAAADDAVVGVVGLAPWLPEELDLTPLRGRRLAVIHGALDRPLPGIPGVNAAQSRRGYERALELGIDASYTLIPAALHGLAVRAPSGRLMRLPRAGRWVALVAEELRRYAQRAAVSDGAGGRRSRR